MNLPLSLSAEYSMKCKEMRYLITDQLMMDLDSSYDDCSIKKLVQFTCIGFIYKIYQFYCLNEMLGLP